MRAPPIKWGSPGNRKTFRAVQLHKCIPQLFDQQRVGETVVNAVISVGETFHLQKANAGRRIRRSAHLRTRQAVGNPGFCEYFMAPPITFGAVWRPVGTHKRYGHELSLWLCPDAPQAWHDAYRAARAEMVGAGFSWTDRGTADGTMTPCWWDTGIAVDLCALANAVDTAIRTAASLREEKARAAEERLAAEVADVAPAAALIRVQLDLMLKERPWAFGRQLSSVRNLLNVENWNRGGAQYADRLLSNARDNVLRATERLSRTPPAAWFARAADPDVRAGALSACRIMSAMDDDWAAVENGRGWSQATTWTGHTLSEMSELDQGQASHALAILHGHRLQLPDPLNVLLFGSAPTRRRRPAPADAPTLAL